MAVESEVGKGTKVTVLLPEADGPAAKSRKTSRKAPSVVSSAQTILLVDDEEMIRSAGKRLLEKLGYSVLLAENGQRAVQMYLEKKSEVSLVILDMVMPLMDGVETFLKLKELNPKLSIVLSSGYGEQDKDYGPLVAQAAGFLQKPFDLQAIAEMVGSALK